MGKKKPSKEELYNMYLSLGDERTLKKLADLSGYAESTLQKFSADGKWKERIREEVEEGKSVVRALVADNSLAVQIVESEVYSALSKKILETLQSKLHLLENVESVRDVKTLLDIHRVIQGQPTEVTQVNQGGEEKYKNLSEEELLILAKLN